MEWLVAGLVVAAVAAVVALVARHGRRRGGERAGADVWNEVREYRRDLDVSRGTFLEDPSWTHRGRTKRP
jgi:putative intracellular protease/amidase